MHTVAEMGMDLESKNHDNLFISKIIDQAGIRKKYFHILYPIIIIF